MCPLAGGAAINPGGWNEQMADDERQSYRGPEPTRWGIVIALVALASALALLIYIAT